MNYFAFGSNMNEKRMISRGINFTSKKPATLNNYKLVINKKSKKNPNIGFANIIEDNQSNVEGILYEVDINSILKLDNFEGFPIHYRRETLNVGGENAIVYIANPKWTTTTELKTTEDYKNHILEGKDFLTEKYFKYLKNIKTL